MEEKKMREKVNVELIFERVKNLDDSEKCLLKRGKGKPFERLPWITKAQFYDVTKDTNFERFGNRGCNFLMYMISIYIDQDCKNGSLFEELLKDIYKNGNLSAKLRIGCMCDEQDNYVRMDCVRHYVRIFCKEKNINIVKLTSDILNWDYKVKNTWAKTVAGVKLEEN